MDSAHLPPFGVGISTQLLQGCQDIKGPIPPSFLISQLQINGIFFYFPNMFIYYFLNLPTQVERFGLLQPLKKMLKQYLSINY